MQGSHHSRKIAHKQVNYPDTIEKLSKLQKNVPVYTTQTITEDKNKKYDTLKIKEFHETLNATIKVLLSQFIFKLQFHCRMNVNEITESDYITEK